MKGTKMKKYILPESGNFYKANLHCHSTYSDGTKTPEEIKELYMKLGYSVVAYTDHEILISHSELTDENFLALNGFEMSIDEPTVNSKGYRKCCHVCYIALEPDNLVQPCWNRKNHLWGNAPAHRDEVKFDENEPDYITRFGPEGISESMKICRDKGFFVTYNHPTWSLEDYEDYMNYDGMHAFEMFNGGCIVVGFDDYNPRVYDDMLRAGKKIYCIGADDNHNAHPDSSRHSDSGWAWTVIKADNLDYRTITKALEDGNFYASEGPEIYDLWYEDGNIHVRCSEADRICCNYKSRNAGIVLAENGKLVTEAVFGFPKEREYARITVIDAQGRHACTNAIFFEDLEK
jgi:hypothetical protein